MKGDSIVVEPHHRKAAQGILDVVADDLQRAEKYAISIAGESGSGKSETATALADALHDRGISASILQQDDYFVHPPRTNDRTRRGDIAWVGPQEVRLDLMDNHVAEFLAGAATISKPLVVYEDDRIDAETMSVEGARVLVVEGTYTTLLKNVQKRVFIDRTWVQTRAHREKRSRHPSELDPFIDRVLEIEHEIISSHEVHSNVVVASNYETVKSR